MKQEFEYTRSIRKTILSVIESYSIKQLNHIPTGFNNNLIWHLGHLLVTEQLICYRLAGLTPHVTKEFIRRYRIGSFPKGDADAEEIGFIKDNFLSSIEQTEADYEEGLFKQYHSYMTPYGFPLNSIEDGIRFNNLHEAMHYGYILALKKALPQLA